MSTGVNTIDTTFRTMFSDEFRMDFDRTQSLLRKTVRSDGVKNGSVAQFDIVDPADEAQERGRDGRIPISQLGLSAVTATIRENFKKYRVDDFDLFRSNPSTRMAMTKRGIGAVNKAIDSVIINELDTTSNEVSGTASILSTLSAVSDWVVRLWNNDVPQDGRVWGLITPTAAMQMLRINEYKSQDFIRIEDKPVAMNSMETQGYRSWMGVKWIQHTGLTGRGGASANCYIYHEDAVGHMIDGDPAMLLYYDEMEDQYGCWSRVRHAARVCLPRGIIRYRHNDTTALTA